MRDCAAVLADRRLLGWAAVWGVVSLVAFGLVAAIIPNPVFGRQIPPEPFAIGVWLASAPLMGILAATYMVPASATARPMVFAAPAAGFAGATSAVAASPATGYAGAMPVAASAADTRGTTLGTIAGFGAFLAIGCPVCNKIALVLLGTSGALTIFAPIQPLIGAASLALLAGTLAWRLRSRARGGACAVRPV
jgi:hypothetical protein